MIIRYMQQTITKIFMYCRNQLTKYFAKIQLFSCFHKLY